LEQFSTLFETNLVCCYNCKHWVLNENVLVVVVIDEARGLPNEKDPNNSLFLAQKRSLADAYDDDSSNIHMFGVFIDMSLKTANFALSIANDPSTRAFQ
jgi:hypothetical protein